MLRNNTRNTLKVCFLQLNHNLSVKDEHWTYCAHNQDCSEVMWHNTGKPWWGFINWINFWLVSVLDPLIVKLVRTHTQWHYPQFKSGALSCSHAASVFFHTTVVPPLPSAISISILYGSSRALLNPPNQDQDEKCSGSLYERPSSETE